LEALERVIKSDCFWVWKAFIIIIIIIWIFLILN
jgi:hypothetical protein